MGICFDHLGFCLSQKSVMNTRTKKKRGSSLFSFLLDLIGMRTCTPKAQLLVIVLNLVISTIGSAGSQSRVSSLLIFCLSHDGGVCYEYSYHFGSWKHFSEPFSLSTAPHFLRADRLLRSALCVFRRFSFLPFRLRSPLSSRLSSWQVLPRTLLSSWRIR